MIIALQRAANTPMELTKQNYYQCVEDMGKIWVDMMAVNYGNRKVETKMGMGKPGEQPLGMVIPDMEFISDFDFYTLRKVQLAVKQDVGASSYWSEMASMQTMDNLLMNGLITPEQYIERLPSGYISNPVKLLEELKAARGLHVEQANSGTLAKPPESGELPVTGGSGNGGMQRALNREGA